MGVMGPVQPKGTNLPGVALSSIPHVPSENPIGTMYKKAMAAMENPDMTSQQKSEILTAVMAEIRQEIKQAIGQRNIHEQQFLKAMKEAMSEEDSPKLKRMPERSEDDDEEKDEDAVETTKGVLGQTETEKSLETIQGNTAVLQNWHDKKMGELNQEATTIQQRYREDIADATKELGPLRDQAYSKLMETPTFQKLVEKNDALKDEMQTLEKERSDVRQQLSALKDTPSSSPEKQTELEQRAEQLGKSLERVKSEQASCERRIAERVDQHPDVQSGLEKVSQLQTNRAVALDKIAQQRASVSQTYNQQMQNLQAMERDVQHIKQGLTNLKPLDEQKQNMVVAAAAQAAIQQQQVDPAPSVSTQSHSSWPKEFVAADVTAALKTALGKDAEMTEGKGHDCMVVKTGAHTSLKAGNKGIQFVSDKNATQAEKDQNYDQGAKAFKEMFPNGPDARPMILQSKDPVQMQSMARAADKAGIDLSRIQDKNGNGCQKNQDGTYSFAPKPKPGTQQQEQQQEQQQQQVGRPSITPSLSSR